MKKLKICKRMPTIMTLTKDTLKNMIAIKTWEERHGQSKWWSTGILFVQQKRANNIKAST